MKQDRRKTTGELIDELFTANEDEIYDALSQGLFKGSRTAEILLELDYRITGCRNRERFERTIEGSRQDEIMKRESFERKRRYV